MAFDDLPATLRRRARQWVKRDESSAREATVLMRAADELVVRRRCATEPEQEAIDQLGNVTIMRACLMRLAEIVFDSQPPQHVKQAVAEQLRIANNVRPPYYARRILSIEVVEGQPFEVFLGRVKELYDQHTGGVTHGEEEHEEDNSVHTEPLGAGRDADQHAHAEAASLNAGSGQEERLRSAGRSGARDRQPAEVGAGDDAGAADGEDAERRG